MRYVRGDCVEFIVERKDTTSQQAWGRFRAKKPLPACIPLMLGDCLQSTHSCLDYLVRQLVMVGKGKPSTKHAFPIAEHVNQFNEFIRRRTLDGVPVEAIAIIESLQPYNQPGNPHDSGLWILKTLTNTHKHRDILLTVLGACHAPEDADVFERNGDRYTMAPIGPINLDAEFGPFPIVEGVVVKMNRNFALDIVFEQEPFRGKRMQVAVTGACLCVRNEVLPLFEKFFC